MVNSKPEEPESEAADFAILIVGAARAVADRLGAAVVKDGINDMRAPYGYVIRALAERPLRVTELAEMLGVSKPAAVKVVDEMERRRLLRRVPLKGDRRSKVLRLTDKGERVRSAARHESRELERELRAELSDEDVDAMRRVLLRFLELHGGLEEAQAGRARAPW
jgi:MarR family transcriptional regulator for hemolysin